MTTPAPVGTPLPETKILPARKTAPRKSATKAVAATKPSVAPKVALKAPAAAKAKPQKAAPAMPAPEKETKAKKPKLVRDSFTIPKDEYLALDSLKQRAIELGRPTKKSELLRAGLKALGGMSAPALRAALEAVPAIKTGRPKNDK